MNRRRSTPTATAAAAAVPHLPRPPRDGVQGLELGRAREALVQPARPTRSRRATVEMRVGGAFEVCMRSPAGEEHWTRGTFVEVDAAHAGW